MAISNDPIDPVFVDDQGITTWLEKLGGRPGIKVEVIGSSRSGRPLYGFRIGNGGKVFTITAGAHADEPAGPLTAMVFADWLTAGSAEAAAVLASFNFLICPQVNPDGAQANSAWFAPTAEWERYLQHVQRELPGDDVEFGYPGDGKGALRPENAAVAAFLSTGNPAVAHASLHSMAFAEGAWFLLGGRSIADDGLREKLASLAAAQGFGLHDIERNGDKGFTRIAPGFCTTPDSRAMAQHFRNMGDEHMAERFHYSSMEWTLSRNPQAHVLVTEIPVFALVQSYQTDPQTNQGAAFDTNPPAASRNGPAPGSTAYEKFRDHLKAARAAGNMDDIRKLVVEYKVIAVPFEAQCRLMLASLRALARAAAMTS